MNKMLTSKKFKDFFQKNVAALKNAKSPEHYDRAYFAFCKFSDYGKTSYFTALPFA